jgi:hypothetical protein
MLQWVTGSKVVPSDIFNTFSKILFNERSFQLYVLNKRQNHSTTENSYFRWHNGSDIFAVFTSLKMVTLVAKTCWSITCNTTNIKIPLCICWYSCTVKFDKLLLFFFFFSSGSGAYAPDALQPVGLLCNPVNPPYVWTFPLSLPDASTSFSTREIQAAKGGTYGRECYPRILPKCRIPRYI